MKRVPYIIGAGIISATLMAAIPAYAEPTNQGGGPSGPAGGAQMTPPPSQPGQVGGGDKGDQGKAAADTMNKKGDEAVDNQGNGASDNNKHKSKNAEQGNRGEAKEAGQDQNDNAKHGAEPRKGDDKAAADDGKDQKGERSGARVSLDSSQRTKIQTYFRDHKPAGQRVERSAVSVSLGFAVPSTIILAPLPPDVVFVSAACPLQYFIWADDLVIVDSCSREVIDIIPGAA